MPWKTSDKRITSLVRIITNTGDTSGDAANDLTKEFYSSAVKVARQLVRRWKRDPEEADELANDIANWVLMQVLKKIADGSTNNSDRKGLWNYIRKAVFRFAERRRAKSDLERQHHVSTIANFSTFIGKEDTPEVNIELPDDLFNSYLSSVMKKFGPDKLITKAVMLELEGLNQEQIAEKLNTTQASVSRKLHFAKLHLLSVGTD